MSVQWSSKFSCQINTSIKHPIRICVIVAWDNPAERLCEALMRLRTREQGHCSVICDACMRISANDIDKSLQSRAEFVHDSSSEMRSMRLPQKQQNGISEPIPYSSLVN